MVWRCVFNVCTDLSFSRTENLEGKNLFLFSFPCDGFGIDDKGLDIARDGLESSRREKIDEWMNG
jgi:hypothetical protein